MCEQYILRSNIETNQSLYQNFGQFVWNRLTQLNGDHVCLIDASTDERLTVAELKTRANSIAVALIERGIEKRDKIGFCGENTLPHIVLIYVSYLLGNTSLSLPVSFSKYELEQSIINTGVEVLFVSEKNVKIFEEILNLNDIHIKIVVVFDGNHQKYPTFDQLLAEERDHTLDRIPYFDVNLDDILLMVYSSGSTGAPKTIMQSHRSYICAYNIYPWPYYEPCIIGTVLSVGFSGGRRNMIEIIYGSTLVMCSPLDARSMLGSIEKYRIQVLKIGPLFTRRIFCDQGDCGHDISCLKLIQSTGDYFPAHISKFIRDKYDIDHKEWYGISEFLFVTTGSTANDHYIPGNLGRVSNGTQLKVVDMTTGQTLGPYIDGEVCIRGNTLFSGYYNDDKETNEAFDSEGWYKTGDIGHYDDEERVFITDRLKSLFYSGDANSYTRIIPTDLEKYLLTFTSISDVTVVGVNNRVGAQWPRAYVVPKVGHTVSGTDIEKFVSDNLTVDNQLKAGVVFVEDIRRTDTGKIDRKYYKNMVRDEVVG